VAEGTRSNGENAHARHLAGFMQVNRRVKTRASSTLAAFALAAIAAAAVAYAVSRRRSKELELEEETSKESEAAAEDNAHMPATPTTPRGNTPGHGNPEAQTPEWLRTACHTLARHAVPSPARAVHGLSDRLNGSRDSPEGASSGVNLPVHDSIREEESEVVDREGAAVEEGAQQQQVGRKVRLPTGVALTTALFGAVIAWAWNGTLWSDLAYGRLGWLYGFLVCE